MACGTVAGLGLTLGSAAAGEVANNNIRNQSNNLVAQELAKQQAYQQQASQVFNQSLNKSTPQAANQQVQQGQQQLGNLINNVQAAPLSLSLPSSTSVNTADQNAKTQMSNTAAANTGGYSNYGLQQYLSNLNANSNLGLISNQAQGAASVLPYQLQQAQNSQQGLQALGSLLGAGGQVAGLYNLMNALPNFGSGYDYTFGQPFQYSPNQL